MTERKRPRPRVRETVSLYEAKTDLSSLVERESFPTHTARGCSPVGAPVFRRCSVRIAASRVPDRWRIDR